VLDCPDPAALAAFHSRLLGQPITYQSDDWVVVAADDSRQAWLSRSPRTGTGFSTHGKHS